MANNQKEHLWELCKENIKPLRQGRAQAAIQMAFDESQHAKLNLMKQEYEKQIRAYDGDDPLSIWHEYILWSEQSFPKGGKEQSLTGLIESCMQYLQGKGGIERYKNDKRLLDIFIKFASVCPSPVEVYQNLFANDLCTEFSGLYENWAWLYEHAGNFKKANKIYLKGIEKGAEPLKRLKDMHQSFQERVAQKSIQAAQEEKDAEDDDEKRAVFNKLDPKGKKKTAPVKRVGENVLGSAGVLNGHSSLQNHNQAGPKFTIYQDENRTEDLGLPQQKGAINIPVPSKIAKENRKNPSDWAKQKVSNKISIPFSEVDSVSSLKFEVYHDKETIVHAKPIIGGALAERKLEEEWKVPMFIPEPPDPTKVAMYPKHLVYCGMEEMSPEELKAIRYTKKEDKYNKMAEELENLKAYIVAQDEKINELMKHSGESPAADSQVVHNRSPQNTQISPPNHLYEDSYVTINKSVTANGNFNDTQAPSMVQVIDDTQPEILQLEACKPNQSKNFDDVSLKFAPTQNSYYDESSIRNVGSKLGAQALQGFLSGTINNESKCEKPDDSIAAPFQIYQDNADQSSIQQPFSIYCDEKDTPVKPGFTIFSDENVKPSAPIVMKRPPLVERPLPEKQMSEEKHVAEVQVAPESHIKQKHLYEDSYITINKSVAPNDNFNDTQAPSMVQVVDDFQPEPLQLEPCKTNKSQIFDELSLKSGPIQPSFYDGSSSPTVNTKLAAQALQGFLNGTISNESKFEKPDDSIAAPFEVYQDKTEQPMQQPFSIYCDEKNSPEKPGFTIFSDENVEPNEPVVLKRLPLAERPLPEKKTIQHDDKENIPVEFTSRNPRRALVMTSRDNDNSELAVPLQQDPELPVPDDQTIMLPSDRDDFFKQMKTLASTPNPWSYGFVPQKNEDEECTIKFPSKKRPLQTHDSMHLENQPPATDETSAMSYPAQQPVESAKSTANLEIPKVQILDYDHFDPNKLAAMLLSMDSDE